MLWLRQDPLDPGNFLFCCINCSSFLAKAQAIHPSTPCCHFSNTVCFKSSLAVSEILKNSWGVHPIFIKKAGKAGGDQF
ncbi:hypothetical protein [Martelella mediterranea]|uniref:hypothetical protein n=1 Tax=Martelella mediterranea TaxID=293089 RepID=UPI00104A3FDB|nr:hypothetical protein [Martelella mediterranea]